MATDLSVHEFDDDRPDGAPRVVLVHGAMDRGASFGRVVGYLHNIVVVTYDRRGYANSMSAPVADSLDAHVADLIDVIGTTACSVVGHSLGGVIALTAAARRPDLVRSVGAYEAPLSWMDWWPGATAGSRTLAATDDPSQAAENFMRFLVGNTAWDMLPMRTQQQRRAEGPALLADLRAIRQETPPFDATTMKAPLGVAAGMDSSEHHRKGAEVLADMFATEVTWFEGAGHGGHMSHPGPFAAFVRHVVDLARQG